MNFVMLAMAVPSFYGLQQYNDMTEWAPFAGIVWGKGHDYNVSNETLELRWVQLLDPRFNTQLVQYGLGEALFPKHYRILL